MRQKMAIQRYTSSFKTINSASLSKWKEIPAAVIADCMNRTNVMSSRISPVARGMKLLGQARTVDCFVGDNSASHVAVSMLKPGEILVIDAKAHLDTAAWGGIMTLAAIKQKAGGVVIDGAVRDVEELCELGLPIFSAGTVPKGPSKGFGGVIDGIISCGDCAVKPGDLIIGDDDGISVVQLDKEEQLLKSALKKLDEEEITMSEIEAGTLPYMRLDLKVEDI